MDMTATFPRASLPMALAALLSFSIAAAEPADLPWVVDIQQFEAMKDELTKQLNGRLDILPIGPWIFATNMDGKKARELATRMTHQAATIQRQIFTQTPMTRPVIVFLFKDAGSYFSWNNRLFKGPPPTQMGYYNRTMRTMIMNIGNGEGTLLHEMVHAMAEADFPLIPVWLNEGIGALYEATEPGDGPLRGKTNFRLSQIKSEMRAQKQTRLADLIAMDIPTFYGPRSTSNYAAARFLMQYVQSQGKLEQLYTRIRDKKDPDDTAALRAVLDNKSIDEIEQAVLQYVSTLTFKP